MRIAITGMGGYIGGWLHETLTARGHEVTGQDIMPANDCTSFDLADDQMRQWWLDDCNPELVVHLAALYGRVWGEVDLAETVNENAGLTAVLARDCYDNGARLMYVSSSEVYGAAAYDGPVTAATPLQPLNMYGLSKKWGEEAARLYAPDGLMIVRLNMPYGPSAVTPRPGEIPATSGRVGPRGYNALHTMCWQASHGMDITVHRDTERCFTWAGDAVRGLAVIAESGRAGTWNVCRDDDHQPMGELARRIVTAAGSESRIVQQDTPPGVTVRKRLDNTGLLELGWKPEIHLEAGIESTLDHFRRFDAEGRWRG